MYFSLFSTQICIKLLNHYSAISLSIVIWSLRILFLFFRHNWVCVGVCVCIFIWRSRDSLQYWTCAGKMPIDAWNGGISNHFFFAVQRKVSYLFCQLKHKMERSARRNFARTQRKNGTEKNAAQAARLTIFSCRQMRFVSTCGFLKLISPRCRNVNNICELGLGHLPIPLVNVIKHYYFGICFLILWRWVFVFLSFLLAAHNF